ncbi:MAG: hypothetical protein HRU20_14770 [Pseudomonadales bacterium]|nr:hypothetical protein [Pseudomonadales bacterium]
MSLPIKICIKRLSFSCLALLLLAACSEPKEATAIKSGENNAVDFIGTAAVAKPLTRKIPAHPFMSRQGVNSMHGDSYSSDVHPGMGPLGINPQVLSRKGTKAPGGQCATLTFNKDGRLVGLCAAISGFQIHLLDPEKLDLLAYYKLPIRPSSYEALLHWDKGKIMEDTSGAYFYLDHKDRIVMADSSQTVQRIGHKQNPDGSWAFYQESAWDLSDRVPFDCLKPSNPFPQGECDPITAVMPDYDGLLWWVTRHGRLGTLNMDNGDFHLMQLPGEEIQNGFSVAEDGVYIVSDHAMYRFYADDKGLPTIGWKEIYDRGTQRQIGTINQGSGTTPTLMGTDYVTITDNADGQMNLLVYKRQQDVEGARKICQLALFKKGQSVTDNSMTAFNRSIILENNAGYTHAMNHVDWHAVAGGIVRVDIREDETGCDVVWESDLTSPSTVPKLSLAAGLAYFYSFITQDNGENVWYFTALDFETGKTQFKIKTGAGKNFDNNWAPITLGPDGTAYIGTLKGILAIRDQP